MPKSILFGCLKNNKAYFLPNDYLHIKGTNSIYEYCNFNSQKSQNLKQNIDLSSYIKLAGFRSDIKFYLINNDDANQYSYERNDYLKLVKKICMLPKEIFNCVRNDNYQIECSINEQIEENECAKLIGLYEGDHKIILEYF